MFLVRAAIMLLGIAGVIVGVVSLLAGGWLAVAAVVIAISGVVLGVARLIRRLRGKEAAPPGGGPNGTGSAS
jgi:hypothetical protein